MNFDFGRQLLDINVQLLHPNAKIPEYKSDEAAGFDIACVAGLAGLTDEWMADPRNKVWLDLWSTFETNGLLVIPAGRGSLLRSGFATSFSAGYMCQLADRSGLAVYDGFVKQAGTIDSDYRGEWFLKVFNSGVCDKIIRPGDRVVQGVFLPVLGGCFRRVENLDLSSRGTDGLGSTGIAS